MDPGRPTFAATVPPRDGRPVVLIVDSSPTLRRSVTAVLRDEGFDVRGLEPTGGDSAQLVGLRADLVLLGVRDSADLRLLRALRQESTVPLVVLSSLSRGNTAAMLDMGADDCLYKPFDPNELAARLRAVLRRGAGSGSNRTLAVGDLLVDFENYMAQVKGKLVALQPREWLILRLLGREPGRVVLNTTLLREVWGESYGEDDLQVLRLSISKLRRKLGAPPRSEGPIKTMHRVGYWLDPGGAQPG